MQQQTKLDQNYNYCRDDSLFNNISHTQQQRTEQATEITETTLTLNAIVFYTHNHFWYAHNRHRVTDTLQSIIWRLVLTPQKDVWDSKCPNRVQGQFEEKSSQKVKHFHKCIKNTDFCWRHVCYFIFTKRFQYILLPYFV